MLRIDWNVVTSLATAISMIAFIATAYFVLLQVKDLEKTRYHQITAEVFLTFQSADFMAAQLWLIHKLESTTWENFIANHRADYGEQAFHRVGSFYDRLGTLVRLGLISEKEILSTVGPYAIAVWQKIQPLVREARGIEHSTLFDDFERLLPGCYECYVPNLKTGEARPFSLPARAVPDVPKITIRELRKRLQRGDAITLLDVRRSAVLGVDADRLPGARIVHPDELPDHYGGLPEGHEVVAYCS